MPRVSILPPDVAEKIAAGEVIERPASVVKELVENSIDAGATSISVELEKSGKKLIRVSDDGSGMAREDLELAFQRHATSKIRTVDDLFAIRTMGFRGEALASVAAVARVRAVTRSPEDESGWEAIVEPPEPLAVRPAGRGQGTTFAVRDLFFNIPARRKFLGQDETELGHVTRFLQAAALAFPGIAFSLTSGKRKVIAAPAVESVRRRVAAFYGDDLAADLLEAEGGQEGLKVYALLAPPFYSRSNSYSQYTYVNGRFVRDRILANAVMQAFQGILEQRRYPIAFVYVTIPPDEVDVNVHPTKMEIRFRNAGAVRAAVATVITESLLKADFAPKIAEPGTPFATPRAESIYRSIEAFYDQRVAPGAVRPGGAPMAPGGGPGAGWAGAYQREGGNGQALAMSGQPPTPPQALTQGSLLQVRGTYIVQETDQGIAIIDQHALHERIVFAEVKRRLTEGSLQGQRLLIPDVVDVTPEERLAVEQSRELLARFGIEAESIGEDALAFNSFPPVLSSVDRERLIRDIISDCIQADRSRPAEDAIDAVAEVIACHAAVRAGQPLGTEELAELMQKAETTEARYACPHGRPTKLVLTFDELEKRFKRR